MQDNRTENPTNHNLIIIIIIALLAAFFIWRYFDYKIVKLKSDFGYKLECDSQYELKNS